MIPRVFVSSTYYDLKHVRERIEKFLDNYGFEPVLFESDKVVYQHGKPIDNSAYYEVELCHIMILIVGGRYGSPISTKSVEEERKIYDEDYISITRKEFETAIKKQIPILFFINKNVFSEYQTYKENQEYFEELYKSTSEPKKFRFAHVDHINVFRFIDVLKAKPIKTFEKVEEIEIYIKLQLSGMFYLYLESLKKKSDDNAILDTITELNNVTLRMNEMLTSVGKEILRDDVQEYEKVIENQFKMLIDYFGEEFNSSIKFENSLDFDKDKNFDLGKIVDILYSKSIKSVLPSKSWSTIEEIDDALKFEVKKDNELLNEIQKELLLIDERLVIKRFAFRLLNNKYHKKVLPFIRSNSDEISIKNKLKDELYKNIFDLPF
jgi:hypothetical protein